MESELANVATLDDLVNQISAETGATTTESAAALGGFFGVLAGAAVVLTVVGLIIGILQIIAWWRIFTKAGEKGWKSIIPIYNLYINLKIIGMSFWKWFIGYVLVCFVAGFASGANITWLGAICGLVMLVGVLVFGILYAKNTAKAFGKGTGFAVGLFFLPQIFELILGLGASEYKGVPEKE